VRNFDGAIEVFSSKIPLTNSVPAVVSLVAIGIMQTPYLNYSMCC
jgi:hypothetical protein